MTGSEVETAVATLIIIIITNKVTKRGLFSQLRGEPHSLVPLG